MENLLIELYKDPMEHAPTRKFFLVLGLILGVIFIFSLLVKLVRGTFEAEFPGDWHIVAMVALACSNLLQGLGILPKGNPCFIQISDDMISYRLKPGHQQTDLLLIDVLHIEVKLYSAKVWMKSGESYNLNFEEADGEEMRQLKQRLEALNQVVKTPVMMAA